jgi:hypothetical protein
MGVSVDAALLSTAVLTALGAQPPAQAGVGEKPAKSSMSAHELPGHVEALCGPPRPREFTCFGLRRTDVTPHKALQAAGYVPEGFGPADLRSAYGLPADGGAGKTIANGHGHLERPAGHLDRGLPGPRPTPSATPNTGRSARRDSTITRWTLGQA